MGYNAEYMGMNLFKLSCLLLLIAICLITVTEGFRLAQSQDSYPWTNCNAFESTKKNCPRGEACLKLKSYQSYAWNWAMRCQGREEYISRFQFQSGGLK